jgi:hypothetical protein
MNYFLEYRVGSILISLGFKGGSYRLPKNIAPSSYKKIPMPQYKIFTAIPQEGLAWSGKTGWC